VADNRGNVVSLTQTLSRSFGSKVATQGLGFPYNNFLAPFTADKSQCPGYLRPDTPIMTLMSPTVVLKDGKLFAALGTPGSNMIPPVISEIISNMVDRKMGVRTAVTAPRVLWWDGEKPVGVYIEVVDPITKKDVKALRRMGFTNIFDLRYPPRGETKMSDFGAINAVAFDPETRIFTGVGDPRRYGSAMGPRVIAAHD
jgi:gamma-glutamyltranspeptidase/glutathione hydrolase